MDNYAVFSLFFFNDTATTEIYTLSLHDALPIYSRFYIWDLLSVNDTDLRVQPYEIRYVHLTQHFRGVSDLRVCETAMTTKAKRDFVKKMHKIGRASCRERV